MIHSFVARALISSGFFEFPEFIRQRQLSLACRQRGCYICKTSSGRTTNNAFHPSAASLFGPDCNLRSNDGSAKAMGVGRQREASVGTLVPYPGSLVGPEDRRKDACLEGLCRMQPSPGRPPAVAAQHHAHRKRRLPVDVTCDVYTRQAFPGPNTTTLSLYSSIAWNQRCAHKRWDPQWRHPQAGTHFHIFAKARLTQRAEFVRGGQLLDLTQELHRTKRGPNVKPQQRTVGSQTSTCTTDLGDLQQWGTIQAPHRLELQRLQHRINIIIQDVCEGGPAAAGHQPTGDFQCLQTRINSIIRDMDALCRSYSAEAAAGFLPVSDQPNPQPGCLRSASSPPTPIRVTASPEVRAQQRRTSPPRLRSHATSPRHKQQNKNQKKRTASTTGTEGAGPRAVRQCRTLLLPHRTCASILRLGCVVNVERKSAPQPLIEKCIVRCHHLVLSSPSPAPLTSQVVAAQNYQLKYETFLAETWTADFARPSCAKRPEGPHPGGYVGALG